MKQRVKVLFSGLAVLAFLYGCGGGQQSQTPTQPPTQTAQNQDPKALFDVPAGSLMSGAAIAFDGSKSTDPDGKITKYAWEFSDGAKADGPKVSHTFNDPGSYEIKLTVTDDKNKSITITKTVAIGDAAASERDEHLRLSDGTQLRIPATAEPRYLLPNATEGTWESSISAMIFEYLIQTNINLENIPGVATWEWNPETLTYTFSIRPGVKFHDGVELTCDDVMFSYKAWIHPDYPGVRFGNFEHIVGAKAYRNGETTEWPIPGLNCVDSYTFTVQLDQIQRTFLPYAVASSGIMPKHVYEPYLEANGYDKLQGAELELGKFVGYGPYKFGEWEPGQYIKLVRNDNYWQSREVEIEDQNPLGGVEEIYFVFIADQATQLAKLLANEVDVLDTRPAVNQYFELKENPNYNTYEFPQLVYDYWHWNLRNPLFQQTEVRQAMCYALDRQSLVDEVLQGLGDLTNGPTHPLRWDWDESLAEIHPNYNPEKTVQLMESAGWTIEKNADGTIKEGAVWTKMVDGQQLKMEFEIATNQGNNRRINYMILIQEQLAKLGFQTTTRVLDTNAFYNDYLDGTFAFQTAIAGWRMGTDPDGTDLWHTKSIGTSFNWHAYSNAEVDALIEEGLKYANIEDARPIYQEMNRKLVETMGYCWLNFQNGTFAAKKGLMEMEPFSPLGPTSFIYDWYWEGKGIPVTVKKTTN